MIEDYQSRKLTATVKEPRLFVMRACERKGAKISDEAGYIVTTTYHGKLYDIKPDGHRKGYYVPGSKPLARFGVWKSYGPNDHEIALDAMNVGKKAKKDVCYLIGPCGFIPMLDGDEIDEEMLRLVRDGIPDEVSSVGQSDEHVSSSDKKN